MGALFPEHWTKTGVNAKKLNKQVVDHDRWDDEDLVRMLEELPPFAAARDALGKFAETGDEAMSDAFWSFLKAEPDLIDAEKIDPAYLVNRRVMEMMAELDEAARLRRYSVNDDVQAALSCVSMEEDLETLFDKTKLQRQKAEQLRDALQKLADALQERTDLDDLVQRWKGNEGIEDEPPDGEGEGEGDGQGEGEGEGQGQGGQPGEPGEGQGQPGGGSGSGLTPEQAEQLAEYGQQLADLDNLVEALQNAAESAGKDFEDAMDKGQGTVRMILKDALTKAADEASALNDTATAWGLEPGTLQHMPATERMELAKRLNNDRFKRIADLFGPMRNLMLSEQQRKTVLVNEELYDVEIGNEIGRLLPSEILNLREGPTRLDFLRRYTESGLMQYAMQGKEKLSRGAIILSEDGSGSMGGEREMWAKAVMLCLLHLAKIQKRSMYVIHFGGPGQFKLLSFEDPNDWNIEKILEAAELFFGGGTDFATPMKVCLDLLRKEFEAKGAVRGDHVFVTDDECGVTKDFMEEYLGESERMQFTTWGISVSGADRRQGPLNEMSQGKVATIKDILSGDDIRQIFRGL